LAQVVITASGTPAPLRRLIMFCFAFLTTRAVGSKTTQPQWTNATKPAETTPVGANTTKGNVKLGVLMNATEAASFVKDAKVILGVETGIAKTLNLANVSWVEATLSVVTSRRLEAAVNGIANIDVDFVITVPATATSALSSSTLEESLQKTDQVSKDQWKAALTTEITKAAPAHANLKFRVSSIADKPLTAQAPGTQLRWSGRSS